jgi:CheY-like chemotaxis protein
LVDVDLPNLSGYRVAREIRSAPGLEGALLVAVGGLYEPQDSVLAETSGFDRHLAKPIDVDELKNLAAGHLQKRPA